MSATQTERQRYDDLTDEEKAFIDTYVQATVSPDTETPMPVTVERQLDLDMGEGNRISTEYADIIEERQDALGAGTLSEEDLFDPADLDADDEADAQSDETPDAPDIPADEIDGPVIEHEGLTIPVADLDEYWEERYISYDQLRQIAMDHDVRGNLGADDLIERLEEATGYTESDGRQEESQQQQRVSKPADEKTYADLTPLQQRVIDNWVRNPDQTKSAIEDAADASPGYSARTFRNYDHIRKPRREAYKRGILSDTHLNTPDKDEFTDADGNKLPDDEQPQGTPLETVLEEQGVDMTVDELKALYEEAGDDTDTETDDDTEPEPTAEPEEPDVPDELDLDSESVAQQEDIAETQEAIQSLRETIETVQEDVDDLRTTVGEFDSARIDNLTQRVETIESQVDQLKTALPGDDLDETDQITVGLEMDQWLTIIRAMDKRLDRDAELGRDGSLERDEQIFNQLISQIN